MTKVDSYASSIGFNGSWSGIEVALGAGIESTHSKPIFTSVQQVLQKGNVITDGTAFSGAAKALTNPKWVLHEGVGFVFPETQTVQIQASAQTGSVKRIFGLGSSATVVSHPRRACSRRIAARNRVCSRSDCSGGARVRVGVGVK